MRLPKLTGKDFVRLVEVVFKFVLKVTILLWKLYHDNT